MTYTLISGSNDITRDSDGARIASDPANTDWINYQAWLAAGNTPNAAFIPGAIVPETISQRQFMEQLAIGGDITWDECLSYLGEGVIPQMFLTAITWIPTNVDPNAQNKAKTAFIGATSFDRHNPLVIIMGELIGKTDAQLDAIWIAAATIQ